jgi:hypothetical protein
MPAKFQRMAHEFRIFARKCGVVVNDPDDDCTIISNYRAIILNHWAMLLNHCAIIRNHWATILNHCAIISNHCATILNNGAIISNYWAIILHNGARISNNGAIILNYGAGMPPSCAALARGYPHWMPSGIRHSAIRMTEEAQRGTPEGVKHG